jgi:hypothetical protein
MRTAAAGASSPTNQSNIWRTYFREASDWLFEEDEEKRKPPATVAFLFGPNVSILVKDILATRMVLRVLSILPIERLRPNGFG